VPVVPRSEWGQRLPGDYFLREPFAPPESGELLLRYSCSGCGAAQHAWDREGGGATVHEVRVSEGFTQHRRRCGQKGQDG
jgi:hypothetical protein